MPELARRLGIGEFLVKDETSRLGLPAFKILGASWAAYRELCGRLELDPLEMSIDALHHALRAERFPLVTASEGNHGRAVARVASWLGLGARVYLPDSTAVARRDAIVAEGAEVVMVDGDYDDAVDKAAHDADGVLIQDQATPGYEKIPGLIADGYRSIFAEVDQQLQGEDPPDLVLVQIGVGSFASAAVAHFRREGGRGVPKLVGVEPLGAECAMAAASHGGIVTLPSTRESIMAGLNCGTVSELAWPVLSSGVEVFVAVGDERCREAVRQLADCGMEVGASGAAGLAGLLELLGGPGSAVARAHLSLNESTKVLVVATEGVTNPEE